MGMAEIDGRVEDQSMPPESGCYEIRFRLAGYEALTPAFGLLILGAGIFIPRASLLGRVIGIAGGALFTVPYVILLVRRTIVFRADQAGITLGPEVLKFQFSTVFIPWADIRKVILYKITRASRTMGRQRGTYIGIVPHDRAPAVTVMRTGLALSAGAAVRSSRATAVAPLRRRAGGPCSQACSLESGRPWTVAHLDRHAEQGSRPATCRTTSGRC